MKSNVPFLKAQWKELTLVNFALEPDFLINILPVGLDPDLLHGKAYASLVAFDFESIRVGGIPWPGYTQFPELNLRVYVRCSEAGRRGVFFIRELIPGKIPTAIARVAYNEPYSACPLTRSHQALVNGAQVQRTDWIWKGAPNYLEVEVGPETMMPATDEDANWFKEQEWGFGHSRLGELLRYHVTHPRWMVRKVHRCDYEVDWLGLYGPIWARQLEGAEPDSLMHCIGSEIAVYPPRSIDRPNYH